MLRDEVCEFEGLKKEVRERWKIRCEGGGESGGSELDSDPDLDQWKTLWIRIRNAVLICYSPIPLSTTHHKQQPVTHPPSPLPPPLTHYQCITWSIHNHPYQCSPDWVRTIFATTGSSNPLGGGQPPSTKIIQIRIRPTCFITILLEFCFRHPCQIIFNFKV